jgi:hypothetical protein
MAVFQSLGRCGEGKMSLPGIEPQSFGSYPKVSKKGKVVPVLS